MNTRGPALGAFMIAALFSPSARAQNADTASMGASILNQQVTPIAGDFNGDGKTDYALIGSKAVYTYLSDGNGIFTEIVYSYPGGWAFGSPPNASWTPIVGDFNGDKKTDFALVQNSTVHTFLSNGNGTFTGGTYAMPKGWIFGSPPAASWTPIVGDFNADGKTDFALAENSTLATFLSNGDGTFKAGGFSFNQSFGNPPSASYTVLSGDLNADGKADFAFASSSAIYSFFSKGDGTFTATVYDIPANRQANVNDHALLDGLIGDFKTKGAPPSYTAFAGDLNGDHKIDLAYVTSTQIFAYFSAGDGAFTPTLYNIESGWAFGNPPGASWTLIAGDFNGDGKADFGLLQNATFHTFLSSGTGSFTQGTYGIPNGWSFGSPPSAAYIAIGGNFDGVDGTDFLLFYDGLYYCFLSNGNGTFRGSVY